MKGISSFNSILLDMFFRSALKHVIHPILCPVLQHAFRSDSLIKCLLFWKWPFIYPNKAASGWDYRQILPALHRLLRLWSDVYPTKKAEHFLGGGVLGLFILVVEQKKYFLEPLGILSVLYY